MMLSWAFLYALGFVDDSVNAQNMTPVSRTSGCRYRSLMCMLLDTCNVWANGSKCGMEGRGGTSRAYPVLAALLTCTLPASWPVARANCASSLLAFLALMDSPSCGRCPTWPVPPRAIQHTKPRPVRECGDQLRPRTGTAPLQSSNVARTKASPMA